MLFAAGGKNEYSTACFAVSRCFDVSECRVFFRKTAWGAAVSFPGCFLAGMNRKMCVAEILVLKSEKFNIVEIFGGAKDNAIPREADATLCFENLNLKTQILNVHI